MLWSILCWLFGVDMEEWQSEQAQTRFECRMQYLSENKEWGWRDTFHVKWSTLMYLYKGGD